MDSESRAIRLPIPGLGKMLFLCVAAFVVWSIWSADLDSPSNPQKKRREKLWSPDATAIERIQAVEEWAVQGEYALPELTRALGSPHENVRSTAVLALSRIGPLAQGCVPRLNELMRDPSESVRANVIHALLQIDYHLDEAVPLLVDRLADTDENVRSCAEEALIKIGRPAVIPVCNFLLKTKGPGRRHGLSVLMNLQLEHDRIAAVAHQLLLDENAEVQARAIIILTFLDGFTVDELTPYLDSPSAEVQYLVLRALTQRPAEAEHVVPQVLKLLAFDHAEIDEEHIDRRLVEHGFMLLKEMGPAAREALPLIDAYLARDNAWLRSLAVDVASMLADDDENFERLCRAVLNDPAPMVVSSAAAALQQAFPERVEEIFPPLKQRLTGGHPDEVMLAASAVYGLGPAAAALSPTLVECLDEAQLPRAVVVLALGRIGAGARDAVPRLVELAAVEDLQTSVFWSLARIAPPPEYYDDIERHVVKSLNETRGSVHMGIATMRSALVEERVRKRIYAFELLGQLAGDRPEFSDLLISNVSEPDSSVRWTVLWSLTALKDRDEQIVPLMVDSMGDSSRYVQATVLMGLGRLAAQPELSVPLLMDYLQHPDPYLSSAAAMSLAAFPAHAESAVDILHELIASESNTIRNVNRQLVSTWETRRFPGHLKPLHDISVKQAAETALAAIEMHSSATASLVPGGE